MGKFLSFLNETAGWGIMNPLETVGRAIVNRIEINKNSCMQTGGYHVYNGKVKAERERKNVTERRNENCESE